MWVGVGVVCDEYNSYYVYIFLRFCIVMHFLFIPVKHVVLTFVSEILHYRNDCYCYMSVRYCTIEMTAIVICQ